MAYKDEYEVARLHADPAFLAQLDAQFKHGYTVKYNLAPPTISKRDPVTGHLVKRQFGPGWVRHFAGSPSSRASVRLTPSAKTERRIGCS
jgi:indolepyruvate ferredoxin oxidoreductase